MLSDLLDPATRMPRHRAFWAVPGGLILAQLAALWLLCSQQVQQAEQRQARSPAAPAALQTFAVADCLHYIPGSTVTGCAGRPTRDERGAGLPPQRLVEAAPTGGTIPVKYYSL